MSASQGKVTPYPLAMVLCDGVWRDPYSGKFTIIGTFSTIGGQTFPLVAPIMSVYASLTDGRGTIPICLELVDVDEEREPILKLEEEMEFTDPRMIAELVFQATNVIFPEPGEYRFKLLANNEFMIERRLLVLGPPQQDSGDSHD